MKFGYTEINPIICIVQYKYLLLPQKGVIGDGKMEREVQSMSEIKKMSINYSDENDQNLNIEFYDSFKSGIEIYTLKSNKKVYVLKSACLQMSVKYFSRDGLSCTWIYGIEKNGVKQEARFSKEIFVAPIKKGEPYENGEIPNPITTIKSILGDIIFDTKEKYYIEVIENGNIISKSNYIEFES